MNAPTPACWPEHTSFRESLYYVVRVYFTTLAERDRLAGQLDALETSTAGGFIATEQSKKPTPAWPGWRPAIPTWRVGWTLAIAGRR